jgi:septal ring factor EnvC (AmiA/AmiB activator)
MILLKNLRVPLVAVTILISSSFLAGCGGVSEAEMQQLNSLRDEVKSLETESSHLKDEKAKLEGEIQSINRKLAECNKQKEETRANLDKLPK